MSLILKHEYISQKLYKICLNPINNFKEIWLLTTYGLKILQALVTHRIVHIGTCQSFFDGSNNTSRAGTHGFKISLLLLL